MGQRYWVVLLLLVTSTYIFTLLKISATACEDPYCSMINNQEKDQNRVKYPENESVLPREIMPSSLNITSKKGRVLIYNRVPKCGSTTMLRKIKLISQCNGYSHHSSSQYFNGQLSQLEQNVLEKSWISYPNGYHSYDRHMYFFNLTRAENFIWINFIRDPVERFVSQFYYLRMPSRWASKKEEDRPSEQWLTMQLNTCVMDEHPECLPALDKEHELQLTYFSGQDPECRRVGSRLALQRAKANVEQHYSVVGLLEEMPLSVKVLQSYIPRFFNNSEILFLRSGEVKLNVNKVKPSVSKEVLSILRSRLVEDYEFYDFVNKRLHQQAVAIGVSEDTG